MIANVLAFIATIVVLVAVEIATGGKTPTLLRLGVAVVIFGVANAINAGRRHAPKTSAVATPVLDLPPKEPEAGIPTEDRDVEAAVCAVPSDRRSRTSDFDVGRVVDGRLMLTRDEVQQIIGNWARFNNVLRLVSPAPVMNPGGEVTWYLALSPQSAVFFNQSADQIWSVSPGGVSIRRHPISNIMTGIKVESVDGRSEKIQSGAIPTTWACIFAWISDSYDQFCKHESPWPAGWALLAHELETGHCPQAFLRWGLPYETPQQALATLQSDPGLMGKFVRATNIKRVTPQLEKLGLTQDSPLFTAIECESHRRARNIIITSSCFAPVFVGIGVWIPFVSNAISGGLAATVFSITGIGAAAAIVWATRRYSRHIRRLTSTQ